LLSVNTARDPPIMIAVLISISVAASRGFFAMARDHRLPKPMAKVSPRGTPLVASSVVLTVYLAVILLTQLWNGLFAQAGLPHYVAMFSWGSTFGAFALGIIYLLMCVRAWLRSDRDLRPRSRQHPLRRTGAQRTRSRQNLSNAPNTVRTASFEIATSTPDCPAGWNWVPTHRVAEESRWVA
jgi:hypothetical protein